MGENLLKKGQNKVKILGVRLDSTSIEQVLREVRIRMVRFDSKEASFKPLVITTPNPEIILKTQFDPKLLRFINKSGFAVPDGVGLLLADFFINLENVKSPFSFLVLPFQWFYTIFVYVLFGEKKLSSLNLIKGRNLFEALIALANKKSFRVVLLGDCEGSAQKAAEVLKRSYKKVEIFSFSGPLLNAKGGPVDLGNKELESEILLSINKIRPHLLFVAFGAPKQEMWLDRNLSRIDVGVAMVVGGTLDYISGKVKTPLLFFEKNGLEWLWRLLIQPKRVGRIFNALIIFPFKLISYKARKIGY